MKLRLSRRLRRQNRRHSRRITLQKIIIIQRTMTMTEAAPPIMEEIPIMKKVLPAEMTLPVSAVPDRQLRIMPASSWEIPMYGAERA